MHLNQGRGSPKRVLQCNASLLSAGQTQSSQPGLPDGDYAQAGKREWNIGEVGGQALDQRTEPIESTI